MCFSSLPQCPLRPSLRSLCPCSAAWIILMHGFFFSLLSISVSTLHTYTLWQKVLAMQRVRGRAAAFGSNAERAQLAHDWPSVETDPDSLLRTNPLHKHTNLQTETIQRMNRGYKEKRQGQLTDCDALKVMQLFNMCKRRKMIIELNILQLRQGRDSDKDESLCFMM